MDLETLHVTRLALMFKEITGIRQWYTMPPAMALDVGDLPVGYTIPGAMQGDPIPSPADSSGVVTVTRQYLARLLIRPLGGGVDIGVQGAEAFAAALPFFALIRDYLLAHPWMHTATLDQLGLARPLRFIDSGFVERPGPGGLQYYAIDTTLTMVSRLYIDTSELS